jgi:hypothetical protein
MRPRERPPRVVIADLSAAGHPPMSPSALPPFDKFPREGASVGRLLAGYSKLEIGLMNCVYMAHGDFDTVLKAMFKNRGETKRINEAKRLGLSTYAALGLEADFLAAIDAMRHCFRIRSQYAHWIWWDDKSGRLAFANVEDIAKIEKRVGELAQLSPHHVTAALLGEQEAWFAYVDGYLAWVNYQGRFLAGTLSHNTVAKPQRLKPPALYLEAF